MAWASGPALTTQPAHAAVRSLTHRRRGKYRRPRRDRAGATVFIESTLLRHRSPNAGLRKSLAQGVQRPLCRDEVDDWIPSVKCVDHRLQTRRGLMDTTLTCQNWC